MQMKRNMAGVEESWVEVKDILVSHQSRTGQATEGQGSATAEHLDRFIASIHLYASDARLPFF